MNTMKLNMTRDRSAFILHCCEQQTQQQKQEKQNEKLINTMATPLGIGTPVLFLKDAISAPTNKIT